MSVLRKIVRKYLCTSLVVHCMLLSAQTNTSKSAQTNTSKEYQIKAVFLFNFAQFVEWPASAFPEEKAPLIIGVFGDDPFGTYLDQAVRGEKVNNHPLVIQRYRNIEDVKECHILFINLSDKEQVTQTCKSLKGKNTLTVSDGSGFIKQGGMIRFVKESNKIKFQINPEAAKADSLTISSKLLRLADVVSASNN